MTTFIKGFIIEPNYVFYGRTSDGYFVPPTLSDYAVTINIVTTDKAFIDNLVAYFQQQHADMSNIIKEIEA